MVDQTLYVIIVVVGFLLGIQVLDYLRTKKQEAIVDKILGNPELRAMLEYEIREIIKQNIDRICGKRERPIDKIKQWLRGERK